MQFFKKCKYNFKKILYIYIYIINQKIYCKCCGKNKDKNNNKLEGKENKKNKYKCSNYNKNKIKDNEIESESEDNKDNKKDNEDNGQHKDIFPDKEEKKNLLFDDLTKILNNNNLLTNKEIINKENYEEKIKNIQTIEDFNEISQNLNKIKNKLINNLNLEKNNLQKEFNKLKNDIDQLNNKEGDIDKILEIKIENNLLDITIFNNFDFNKIEEIKNKISNLKNIYNNGIIEIHKRLIKKLEELDKKNSKNIESNIKKDDINSANDNENILVIYEKINTYQIAIDKGINGLISEIETKIKKIENEKELLKLIGKNEIENDLNNFNNELNNNKSDFNKLSNLLTNINKYINECDTLKKIKETELNTKLNNLNEIKKYIIKNHKNLIKKEDDINVEIKIDNITDYNNTIANIGNLENLIKTAINDIKNSLKTEINALNNDLEKYKIDKIDLDILDNLNSYSSSLESLTKNSLEHDINNINETIEHKKNSLENEQKDIQGKQNELKKLLKEIIDLNDKYKDFNDLKIEVNDEKIDQTFDSSELETIKNNLNNFKNILDIYENNNEKINEYIKLKEKIEKKINEETTYKDEFKDKYEEVVKLLNKEDLTNLDTIIEDLNEVRKYVFSKKYNDELLKILNNKKCGYDDIIKKLNSLNNFYFFNIVNNKLFLNNKNNVDIILFDETINQIEDNIGKKTVDKQKKIDEFYNKKKEYFYENLKDSEFKIDENLENIIENMNIHYQNKAIQKNKYNIDEFSNLLKELYTKMKNYFTDDGIYRFLNKLCFLYHNGIIEKIIDYNDKKKYIILPNISEDVDTFITNSSYKGGKILDKNGKFKEFRCDGKCKKCLSCIMSNFFDKYQKDFYRDILKQQKRSSKFDVPIYFKLYFNNLLQEKYKIKSTDNVDKFGNTIKAIPEDICIMNINYKKELFFDTIDLMWALTYCILKFSNIFNENEKKYDDKIILYKVLYFDDIKDTIKRRDNLCDLVTSTSVFGPYYRFYKLGKYPFCYKAEVEKFLCIYNYLFSFSKIGYLLDKELEIGYVFLDKFELMTEKDLDFIKIKDETLYNKLGEAFYKIYTNVESDKRDIYKKILIGNFFCNCKTYFEIKGINKKFIEENVLLEGTKYADFIDDIKSIPYYSQESGERVVKYISID